MTQPMRRVGFVCLSGLLFLAACATSNRQVRALDKESRDFYSKVRYIITSDESKTFLALPTPEARKTFIEDFWKRRDPTPVTDINEYKEEYFKRIAQANRLFSGGGSPGWLQDRGRVWITLGPPDVREPYPRGYTFYGRPVEIWWYGMFAIYFIDENWTDDYRLDPTSAIDMSAINQAQVSWNKPLVRMSKEALAAAPAASVFDLKVEKTDGGAKLRLVCPYKNLWLKLNGDRFQGNLEVVGLATDGGGAQVWTCKQSCPVEISQAQLKEMLEKDFEIALDMPVAPGAYSLKITVTNVADGSKSEIEKKIEI